MHDGHLVDLSLAELEAFDPNHRPYGDERRFLCPVPGECSSKTTPSRHRSLSANMSTGKFWCHRCHATGVLQEWRSEQGPISKFQMRKTQHTLLHAAFAVVPPPAPQSNRANRPEEAASEG